MIVVIATPEPGSALLYGKSGPQPPLLDEYHVEWMPKLREAAYAVADDARRDEPGQVIIMAGFRTFVNLLAQRDGDRILLPPSDPPAIGPGSDGDSGCHATTTDRAQTPGDAMNDVQRTSQEQRDQTTAELFVSGLVRNVGLGEHLREGVAHAVRSLLANERAKAAIEPIPIWGLFCPRCFLMHVDKGAFETKPHKEHSCQGCGLTWKPAKVPTVGVQFLPGYKDEPGGPPAPIVAGHGRPGAVHRLDAIAKMKKAIQSVPGGSIFADSYPEAFVDAVRLLGKAREYCPGTNRLPDRPVFDPDAELTEARADVVAAAGELMVDMDDAPVGSLPARLLGANSIIRGQRDEARREVADLRTHRLLLRDVLLRVRQWDMLNPASGSPEPLADGPWLRELIDDALALPVKS